MIKYKAVQRLFFSNILLLIILNLLVKPFYLFGIDVQVQNLVGQEAYGLYFSLLNFSFLFNIFQDLGITNYNTKNIAAHPHLVKGYLGRVLGLRITLGVLYFALTIGLALILGYDNISMHILSLLVLNQILVGMILYFRSNFAGLLWFKTDALFSVLDRVLLIGICLVLLYNGSFRSAFEITWFVYAQTAAYGTVALLGLFLTFRYLKVPVLRLKRNYAVAIIKKSWPFALLVLLMMLYTRMDAVMLERLLPNGKVEAGIYAQGFRILDAVNIFGLLAAGLLLPIFSNLLQNKQPIKPLLNSATKLVLGTAIATGMIAVYFSKELMSWIYYADYTESAIVFPWIILSFIPIAATYIFGTLLTAAGELKRLNQLAALGILVNFTLNWIVIPKYGATGAAVVTLITQSFAGIGQIALVNHYFKFKMNWRLFLQLIGFSISLFAAVYLLDSFYVKSTILEVIIAFAIALFGMFVFRLLSFRALIEQFRAVSLQKNKQQERN